MRLQSAGDMLQVGALLVNPTTPCRLSAGRSRGGLSEGGGAAALPMIRSDTTRPLPRCRFGRKAFGPLPSVAPNDCGETDRGPHPDPGPERQLRTIGLPFTVGPPSGPALFLSSQPRDIVEAVSLGD